MRTIHVPLGELLEAVYADLMETYGDRELALAAVQELGEELMTRSRVEAAADRAR